VLSSAGREGAGTVGYRKSESISPHTKGWLAVFKGAMVKKEQGLQGQSV
jgi:hypothetical protein